MQPQQPLVRRWPAPGQRPRLRPNLLFAHVRLPGEGGKGTPWSAAAGIVKLHGQPLMAGLILRAAVVQQPRPDVIDTREWLGCLRVRQAGIRSWALPGPKLEKPRQF